MTIHRENSYIIKGVDKLLGEELKKELGTDLLKRIKIVDKNGGREGARVYIVFGRGQPSSV